MGRIQASGSDSGEGGESGRGSSMKFAMMYWDRRSGSRTFVQYEVATANVSLSLQEAKALLKLAGVPWLMLTGKEAMTCESCRQGS